MTSLYKFFIYSDGFWFKNVHLDQYRIHFVTENPDKKQTNKQEITILFALNESFIYHDSGSWLKTEKEYDQRVFKKAFSVFKYLPANESKEMK